MLPELGRGSGRGLRSKSLSNPRSAQPPPLLPSHAAKGQNKQNGNKLLDTENIRTVARRGGGGGGE